MSLCRRFYLVPTYQPLERSASTIICFHQRRSRSTKSAIQAALHQGDAQNKRRSASAWNRHENQDIARKSFRGYDFSDDTQFQPPLLTLPHTTAASEFLYGQVVVAAALQARRRQFYKLYMIQKELERSSTRDYRANKDKEMWTLARKAGVEVDVVRPNQVRMLDKASEGKPHNGMVLEASPLPKLPITAFDRVLEPGQPFLARLDHQSREDEQINGTDPHIEYATAFPRFPFVLLLDGVLDPHNLGAIIRSAFFFGADAIVLTTDRTAPLSPTALKASAGASEAMRIFTVRQPRFFLNECKRNGWKVYSSNVNRKDPLLPGRMRRGQPRGTRRHTISTTASEVDRKPCILIIGSEGQGLYPDIQGTADNTIFIEGPRQGELGIDSLNVSVASAILCQFFLSNPKDRHTRGTVFEDDDENTVLNIQDRLF